MAACGRQVNPYARAFVSAGEMLRRSPHLAEHLHVVIRGRHDGERQQPAQQANGGLAAVNVDGRQTSASLFREVCADTNMILMVPLSPFGRLSVAGGVAYVGYRVAGDGLCDAYTRRSGKTFGLCEQRA